jgi:diguanylate cyclase (GGDEF)-like protein
MDENTLSTLLLISDDLNSKIQLKGYLEQRFILFEAAGYNEVIEILSHRQIQFIIIDSTVQEGLGITICREIRQHKRFAYTPIVLIIDTEDEDLVNEAIDAGITNFLTKPFSQESLISCLLLSKHWSSTLQYMTSFSQGLKKIAEHDALTGLYNRYYLYDYGRKEVAKAIRSNQPIALLMIDIDNFKKINDTYGHLVGDEVLTGLAQQIKKNTRTYDIAVRFGGEEFVLLLPGASINQANTVAEKIRKSVESYKFSTKEGIIISITISIGVSILRPGILSLEALIEEADVALYESKEQGRNRVTLKTS